MFLFYEICLNIIYSLHCRSTASAIECNTVISGLTALLVLRSVTTVVTSVVEVDIFLRLFLRSRRSSSCCWLSLGFGLSSGLLEFPTKTSDLALL